jgi:hypothetical protein
VTTPEPQPTQGKAQHYVPKFYLKGFTDKHGALYVFEKFKPLRKSVPKHEAHRPDYYTHTEQGQRDETAEDALKIIESRVAPIICKLANPQYVLKPEDAALLIFFVALTFARVPSWREYLDTLAGKAIKQHQIQLAKDKEKFHKLFSDFEKTKGKAFGVDAEELRQDLLKGQFEIEQKSTAYNLGAMFRSGIYIAEILKDFGYEALYAPQGKFFMTSDSPVYTLQPDREGGASIGMGFGMPRVEVYFPLNKRTCFRLKKNIQPQGRFIEAGHVDQVNRVTMATATRYLFANEGFRRTARLFDERGCVVRPGRDAFLPVPPNTSRILPGS